MKSKDRDISLRMFYNLRSKRKKNSWLVCMPIYEAFVKILKALNKIQLIKIAGNGIAPENFGNGALLFH